MKRYCVTYRSTVTHTCYVDAYDEEHAEEVAGELEVCENEIHETDLELFSIEEIEEN